MPAEDFTVRAVVSPKTIESLRSPRRWRALAASLRGQLWLLWLFIVLLCAFLTVILVGLYQSGSAVQLEAGRRMTRATCESIRSLYAANSMQRGSLPEMDSDLLTVLVSEALADATGVEGGVWERERGFIAYAFPTHEGATTKLDVPAAEMPWIIEQVEKSLAGAVMSEEIRRGARDALILVACPLAGQPQHRVAWTMTRVRTATAEAFDHLTWGLALLLGFALISGGWLAMALSRWSRGISQLEKSLRDHPVDRLPPLERRGHEDIDRVVDALNAFTQRLAAARDEAAALGTKLASAERLAALGRIAAGVAHEIRNPIAAMRLKAENALAHSPERQRAALDVIVGQTDRLNELCESLLSLARPLRMEAREVDVAEWLRDRLRAFNERASAEDIVLHGSSEVGDARFDPVQLARALDNLIINALQHTPAGGRVDISIVRAADVLRVTVSDTGSGIAATVRDHLFEPFASGRAGGTGIGLALAREIAQAHGGTIRTAPSASGAIFELDIPWRAS
jgi:signal transduction histidine kinase